MNMTHDIKFQNVSKCWVWCWNVTCWHSQVLQVWLLTETSSRWRYKIIVSRDTCRVIESHQYKEWDQIKVCQDWESAGCLSRHRMIFMFMKCKKVETRCSVMIWSVRTGLIVQLWVFDQVPVTGSCAHCAVNWTQQCAESNNRPAGLKLNDTTPFIVRVNNM